MPELIHIRAGSVPDHTRSGLVSESVRNRTNHGTARSSRGTRRPLDAVLSTFDSPAAGFRVGARSGFHAWNDDVVAGQPAISTGRSGGNPAFLRAQPCIGRAFSVACGGVLMMASRRGIRFQRGNFESSRRSPIGSLLPSTGSRAAGGPISVNKRFEIEVSQIEIAVARPGIPYPTSMDVAHGSCANGWKYH